MRCAVGHSKVKSSSSCEIECGSKSDDPIACAALHDSATDDVGDCEHRGIAKARGEFGQVNLHVSR